MGIKFTCPACGGALNVKSELAGKRGRCPKCQAKINIPLDDAAGSPAAGDAPAAPPEMVPEARSAPVAKNPAEVAAGPEAATIVTAAPAMSVEPPTAAFAAPQPASAGAVGNDPIAEGPTLQWYAVPPGATSQYGPASGDEFRTWIEEGRITADALVWRQDWADWKRAGTVFPQLESPPVAGTAIPAPATATAAIAAGPMPLPTALAAIPMMAGGPPVAQPAFPVASAAPGAFPTAVPLANDAFPIAGDEPAKRTGGRGKAYRPRSNTGPIIAIVVLLVAMIPLSYFVWKVVSDQIGSAPAQTATGPNDTKQ